MEPFADSLDLGAGTTLPRLLPWDDVYPSALQEGDCVAVYVDEDIRAFQVVDTWPSLTVDNHTMIELANLGSVVPVKISCVDNGRLMARVSLKMARLINK